MKEKKKTFELPHVLIVLLIIMLVVAILTYVVPSGAFERIYDPQTDREIVQDRKSTRLNSSHTS